MEAFMLKVAVYDTKPYDREFFSHAKGFDQIQWTFYEFHLNHHTKESVQGHDAVCVFVNDQVDEECLQTLSRHGIRLIALRCAGFNNVDLACARQLKIPVTRVPAYSPHAVAEHTLGLLLALNRKIHRAYNRVREMNFSLNGLVGFDIAGKTIGVIGTGKIGKIFAKILKGFDAIVIAYDVAPSPEWAEEMGISYCGTLEELFKRSDIISLHLPLEPGTFHLVNRKTISQMKEGVILLNTSRGKLIDTHAVIEALKQGKIAGFAIDTYEEEEGLFFEDLSNQILMDDELSRLLTFPNVLITAHQAFLTHEALQEIARITIENMLCFAKNAPFLPDTQLE